jgi:2'-5' RNA ligase
MPASGEADAAEARAPERHRAFFALWPDAATASALVRSTKRVVRLSGGRPTAKERLHITVAFLGDIGTDELERARSVPPIDVGPFELTLDSLGLFPRSRVLWLAARSTPAPLLQLEERLWEGLTAQGFQREPRIFRPHLTLARRARPVEEDVPPVTWRVEELVLAESLADGRKVYYERLARWPV